MRDITATKKLLAQGISKEQIRQWDLGLKLHNEPTHNRLIEELEGGGKKIKHWEGNRRWITYE